MNLVSPRSRQRRAAAAVLLALLMTAPSAEPARDEPMPGDYRIIGGKVDLGTYAGWQLFHTTCYGCHGVGAVGTDIAPNLVERVKTLTPRQFATRVLTQYRIVRPDNDKGPDNPVARREAIIDEVMRRDRDAPGSLARIVMPAWEGDPQVNPHVLDLFAYLSARADGKLGPGRPTPVARTAP